VNNDGSINKALFREFQIMFVESTEQWELWMNLYVYENRIREKQDTIIQEYQLQTKIQASSKEELKKVFEIQRSLNRPCEDDRNLLKEELEVVSKDLSKMESKKNFWKVTTVVGIPICIVGGAIVGGYIVHRVNQ
jgi:hypothetical protein